MFLVLILTFFICIDLFSTTLVSPSIDSSYHPKGCKLYNHEQQLLKTSKNTNNKIESLNSNDTNTIQNDSDDSSSSYSNNTKQPTKKFVDSATTSKNSRCPFDHDYCHACRQFGHVAKDCTVDAAHYCY